MRILMLGDVIGSPGRQAIQSAVPGLRKELEAGIVIANGENTAGGIGMTPKTADELFQGGVDIITSGNHIWAHKEMVTALDGDIAILRPLNYPPGIPGHGYIIKNDVLVINLLGRTFIGNVDCPFRAVDALLNDLGDGKPRIIIIDFHAEATSEKVAMGWYLDGRVSAVLGTHTHVGTVDARILPQGTACITDVGMVGPIDSVIGDEKESVIHRFLTQLPHRISVGKGNVMLNSVLVEVDDSSGKALQIRRVDREIAHSGQPG